MNDLRFAFRQLMKNPGFTAVAVLTLALGIGANTAIFSVINTLLLRPLPVKEPDELVLLALVGRTGPGYTFSYQLYERLRDGSPNLSGLFAAGGVSKGRMIASGVGGTATEFIRAQPVTGNFFSILGVSAAVGRTLTPYDDLAGKPQPVAVISHSFWRRRFGSDPSMVGKAIKFVDVPLTIVGVAPPGFFGFEVGANPDLWWPMQMVPEVYRSGGPGRLKQEGTWWLRIMGRVPADGNRMQAQAELDVIYQRYITQFAAARASKWNAEIRRAFLERKLQLQPGNVGWTELRRQFRQSLLILMTVVVLVLLIACANVASLLLARAASRQREFSVRSALGAGRLRLVRQLLTESVLLASAGGLLGLLFAQEGTRMLLFFMKLDHDPVSFNVAADGRVLAFTMTVAVLTGILFGLAPALRSSRLDLATALKGTSGRVTGEASRQRLNQLLVVAQVGLSLVLLIGAGLFVRTLGKLKGMDAGFTPESIVLFELDFTTSQDKVRRASLYKELLTRLEALPGVGAASMSTFYLLSGGGWTERVNAVGYVPSPGEDLFCHGLMVSPRFFETLGTPILSGRDFGSQDEQLAGSTKTNTARTAVINRAMARRYFGDANPLGRHFHFGDQPEPKFEIVGVVKDMKYRSLREPVPPTFYMPFFQEPDNTAMTFTLRTRGDSRSLPASIHSVVREIDPTVQVRDLRTIDDVINGSVHKERVLAQIGGFFSIFALTLACLGLHGVLSFSVVQRTPEIGVRVALGAQTRDVLCLVVGQGLKLVLFGSAVGLAGAFTATRFVSSLLFGVEATDPITFGTGSLLLLAVAGLASWLPAHRAAKVDPMEALRYE